MKLFLPLTLTAMLFSCSRTYLYVPFPFNPLNENEFVEQQYDGYKLIKDFAPAKSKDNSYQSFIDVYQSRFGDQELAHINLPSTGNQKMLVIPIDFAEYPSSSLPDNAIDLINQGFFGSDFANQFYSVSSYYAKASNDRLHISGKVAPKWFRSAHYSYANLSQSSSASYNKSALVNLYSEAISWYKANFTDLADYSFKDKYGNTRYAVYFIYSAPYAGYRDNKISKSSMLWAFTVTYPTPISWTSFYMLHEEKGKVDAHTLIHETGHILGLKDYYDTTNIGNSAFVAPMGRVDIMDCSLGDHCSFSKMILDWARPYVVSGECSITLNPFEGNSEFILVPSPSYNGSMFDEYLLIDFYTPGLLNFVDSTKRDDQALKLFSEYGVRIYHVDARLAVYKGMGNIYSSMLSENVSTANSRVDIAFDNNLTKVGSKIDLSNCLIQLLSAETNTQALTPYYVASDINADIAVEGGGISLRRSLFKKGEGINSNMFTDFRWHKDNSPLNINIDIADLSATFAKINFTKK